jgi:hypothetical protein
LFCVDDTGTRLPLFWPTTDEKFTPSLTSALNWLYVAVLPSAAVPV